MMKNKQQLSQIEEYNRGILIVCDKCGKVDINPKTHYLNCDPKREEDKQFYEDNVYTS